MAKGRKTKPDKFKVLEGTFRKDRANSAAPDADKDALAAPSWLPAESLEHFLTIKERISVYGLDSASWTEAAALIAMRITEIERLNAIIEAEGRTYRSETLAGDPVTTDDGLTVTPVKVMIKGHPAVGQRNEAMRHLQALLAEFGLTPASISKVGKSDGQGGKKKDPWESFG